MEENNAMNNVVSEEENKEKTKPRITGAQAVGMLIAAIGIGLSIAASFLKFFHIGSLAEMTAFEGDLRIGSLIIFGILGVVLATILLRDGGAKGYCYAGGFAVLGETLVHYLYVTRRLSHINILWINLADAVKLDIGFYAMIGGGILLLLAGVFLPPITKKPGVVIMFVVVGLLISAGAVYTYVLGLEMVGSEKKDKNNDTKQAEGKKDENDARSKDMSYLTDIMETGEQLVAGDSKRYCEGTELVINLNEGKIVYYVSIGFNETSDWMHKVEAITSHPSNLESPEFCAIKGTITGIVLRTGKMFWRSEGISAITDFSENFYSRWFYQDYARHNAKRPTVQLNERTAKSDDIFFLRDVMWSAEIVTSLARYDMIIYPGAEFIITIENGKVSERCVCGDNAVIEVAWMAYIYEMYPSHEFYSAGFLESSEFSKVNGSIVGVVGKDGNLTWKGNGISAITSYSKDFAQEVGQN